MRLGAFSVADVDPDASAVDSDRCLAVVRLAETLERAGLDSLWVAEHHFRGGGACPSPPVLLAACGARTQRLRLGSLVCVLPFHRPLEVAEEYALLDRLVGGRLNLGLGSGYLASEFVGMGVDPANKRDRFDRAFVTLTAALAGEEFRVEPSAPASVRLNVLPQQRPHPPLWIAVQRREAVPYVAERGVGIALIPYATVLDLPELGEVIRDYRRALPRGVGGNVVAAVHVYAGARPEEGREAFRRYLESRMRSHSTFLEQKVQQAPERSTSEALERAGLAVFDHPEAVVRRLRAFEELGVDELLGIFDFGGLSEDACAQSVAALGAAWERRSVTPAAPVRT